MDHRSSGRGDGLFTPEMLAALDDVVATYGDSSPTSVAERAYLAIRAVDPAFVAANAPIDRRRITRVRHNQP